MRAQERCHSRWSCKTFFGVTLQREIDPPDKTLCRSVEGMSRVLLKLR